VFDLDIGYLDTPGVGLAIQNGLKANAMMPKK